MATLSLATPSGVTFDNSISLRKIAALRAKAPIAEARALNRSIATGRTVMTRVISKDTGLKSATVREQLKITNARPDNLVAVIRAPSKRLPLIEFGARGPTPSRGRGRGVTARLQGRKVYPHAFIATMPGGHVGVYERVAGGVKRGPKPNRSQLPIRQLFGVSLAHVFEKNVDVAYAAAREALVKNLQHEFRFLLSQQAAPGAGARAA